MISSLCRNLLPRTTAAVASQCTRPAVTTTFLAPQSFSSRTFSGSPLDAPENNDIDKGKTLSRDAIADILCDEYGLKMAESKRILATVFDTIVESVTSKETVTIPGFGKFVAVEVGAREYCNPQNHSGPKIHKPATTHVKFRPFKHFKDCVAEGKVDK